MVPDLVGQLTAFLDPLTVFIVVGVLLIADFLDVFSDAGRKFDILFRTIVLVGAGYLIVSAGSTVW